MRDDLSLPILYSIIAHLLLVLLFTVKAVLFPEAIDNFEPALRVDIVDLPDKVAPSTPSLPTAPAPEAQPATKTLPKLDDAPEVVLNPGKDPKNKKNDAKISASEAIEKLKKQMAIDKIRAEMKDEARKDLSQRVAQYKGNVLSPGTELSGVVKLQHENYLTTLDHHVKQYWSLPEWLARRNYSVRVRIYIDEQGFLLKSDLMRGSGNPAYDETVFETLKKAVPFPVPPEKFRAIVSVNGLVLGFPE
jgi:colicin import membrane protein